MPCRNRAIKSYAIFIISAENHTNYVLFSFFFKNKDKRIQNRVSVDSKCIFGTKNKTVMTFRLLCVFLSLFSVETEQVIQEFTGVCMTMHQSTLH